MDHDLASYWMPVLIVLCAVTALRLIVFHYTPMQLFFDEAQYWSWGTALDFGYFSKPPLLAWIIRGTTELCGTGEACVRAASPLLYALTAFVSGLLAARICNRMGGAAGAAFFWTTLLLVSLPGISFGARVISTDAPLLLCFALALLLLDHMRERPTVLTAILLAVAIGLGLMAKYAMIYFVLCSVIWMVFTRDGKQTLWRPSSLIVLWVAALCVAPNIWWNASHDWITFRHTGDNANWQGIKFHWDQMAEFIGAQIGILGPVLFLILVIGFFKRKHQAGGDASFLLCFSLPVLLLMTAQALISRAHANWAAVAFIALCVLAVSYAVTWRARPLLLLAAAVHFVFVGVLAVADLHADRLVTEKVGAAYKRVFGWHELRDDVIRLAKAHNVKTVIADRRNVTAQMLYYLRDEPLQVRTWAADGLPGNYYQMAIPLSDNDEAPVLILNRCPIAPDEAQSLEPIEVVISPRFTRVVHAGLSLNIRGLMPSPC